jgi:hypothetical protein
MRFRNFLQTLLLALITFCFGPFVHAQEGWSFPDFSATQVFPSRKADITMKVYRSGSSVRVERSGAMTTLYVPAKGKVYNLTTYPDHSHQCVSMKPEQARMLPSPLELIQGKIVKRTDAGSDLVDGHSTRIEDVLVVRPDGKTIESKVWEAADLQGIPVKIESYVDRVTLTAMFRDIVITEPEEALFTIPDRCTPFEKMGQVAEVRTPK